METKEIVMKPIIVKFLILVFLVITYGCEQKQAVTVTESKLVYYSGGPMHFGAPNPLAIRVELKLPLGNFDKIQVTFIGDSKYLSTKEVTFLSGRTDKIKVECSEQAFTHAEHRKIAVKLLTGNITTGGPYVLDIPKPVLDGM